MIIILTSASCQACKNIAFVSLQAGVDYTQLRDLLSEGKFQDADDETRALLIKLAGPEAVDRKWVYFTEVREYLVAPKNQDLSACIETSMSENMWLLPCTPRSSMPTNQFLLSAILPDQNLLRTSSMGNVSS